SGCAEGPGRPLRGRPLSRLSPLDLLAPPPASSPEALGVVRRPARRPDLAGAGVVERPKRWVKGRVLPHGAGLRRADAVLQVASATFTVLPTGGACPPCPACACRTTPRRRPSTWPLASSPPFNIWMRVEVCSGRGLRFAC